MNTVNALGLPIVAEPFSCFVERLMEWSKSDEKRYICVCTVHLLMSAHETPLVWSALEQSAAITPDGMPLVWIARQKVSEAERLYGPDLFKAMFERGMSQGLRHFLLGGTPEMLARLEAKLMASWPGNLMVGSAFPMVAEGDIPIDPQLVETLNQANPDIIWVGLGAPKQDIWMYRYRPYLNSPLLIGVGAAFDFLAGTKLQAPRWMQRSGLEWLFRLSTEPHRLWRRYLIYNSRFLWRLAQQYIQTKMRRVAERWQF